MRSPAPRRVAVFDLDDTLVRGDSFARFTRSLLRRQWWRTATSLVLAPVLTPLLVFPPTRLVGVAGFLWLASTGLGEAEFAALARRFAAAHAEERIMVAIDRLQRHMTVGDRVLVVTGCADPLATAICAQLGLDRVEIIAGSLRAGRTGMWPARGCRGSQKVRRLREAGVPLPVDYAYTDNLVDAPLLRAATHRYLIDPSRRDEARARRLLPHPVTVLSSPREDPDR